MASLKGQSIAASFQDLVKRADTYSQTGTNIEIMNDSAVVQPTGLYLESGATTDFVGIGTAAPAVELEVASADRTSVRITGVQSGSDGVIGDLQFFNNADSIGAINVNRKDNDDQSDMTFHTQPTGGAVTERMRIDSSGNVLVSHTAALGYFGADQWSPKLQQLGTQGIVSVRAAADVWGGALHLAKSRGSTASSLSAAADDDRAGGVYFEAHDGTNFENYVGAIEAYLDGAVASNDTPGRLVFSTAADVANTLTERMRIDSAGDVTFTGDLIMADGKGINFAAMTSPADAAGMTAEILDDYEEGLFTPTLTGSSSGEATYNAGTCFGTYTKIGRMVNVNIMMIINNVNTLSGQIRISALPFTVGNVLGYTSLQASGVVGYVNGMTDAISYISCTAFASTTNATLFMLDATGATDLVSVLPTDIDNDFSIRISITYYV